MTWKLTRRDLLKAGFTTAVVGAAGVPIEALSAEEAKGWTLGPGRLPLLRHRLRHPDRHRGRARGRGEGRPASPVNRGLLCAKGYALAQILYGADRLTRPLLRMKDGKFDKKGDFVPVSWEQAFDVMAEQWRRAYQALGPTGVAVMGSGQYTIQEGYAAVKLVKAGWRSNNLDPNARHCMASAVAAFMQTFGIDEPAGCYDDIELTDTVVLWGANMAEMHPMLWARIVDKRLRDPGYRIVNLTTFANRSSEMADLEIVFKPNTDLAILNFIAREIVRRDAVDRDFVNAHCVFAAGPADIGYGLRADGARAFPAEKDTVARERVVVLTREEAIGRGLDPAKRHERPQDVEQGRRALAHPLRGAEGGLEPYTLDFVAPLAKGDPDEPLDAFKAKLQQLAD